MKDSRLVFVVAFVAMASLGTMQPAYGEPTEITVRVLAKDAKFIGSSMGGARVVIRDAETGMVLAQGVTEGSTGNTDSIMREPRRRHVAISDDESAKFTARIDLSVPTLVEVEAFGPLAQRQSANRVSVTHWVVPGRPLSGGDGLLLEMPGLVVNVLGPPTHGTLDAAARSAKLEANVVMMCGCPFEPDGLWDANRLEVAAIVRYKGKVLAPVSLQYAGETSRFTADLPVEVPGIYDVSVYAYDPSNGNTGVDRVTFKVDKPDLLSQVTRK